MSTILIFILLWCWCILCYLYGFHNGYKAWPSKPINKKYLKEEYKEYFK